jgi:peptide/nickel transport system permease protein
VSNPELVRADADPLMGLGGPVTGWQARALRGSAGLVRGRIGVTLALGWLVVIICLALLAPVLPLPAYFDFVGAPKVALGLHAPYLLGTDYLGRSVLVRLIWGTRISLTVGLLAVFLGMIIGLAIGMTAGYFRGRVEAVLTVFIDAALAFPPLILLLAITAVLQQKLSTLIIAFTLLTIPSFARLARANTLAIAQREFVLAARARGTGSFRIIRREILPNVILPTISYSFIIVASVMVAEGSLDYLGLGIPPPTPTWGGMIASGQQFLATNPELVFVPAVVLLLTVLSFYTLGDYGRRRLDVRQAKL